MPAEKQADLLKRPFFPDRLSWEGAGGGNRSGERRSLMLAEKQAGLLKRPFFPNRLSWESAGGKIVQVSAVPLCWWKSKPVS